MGRMNVRVGDVWLSDIAPWGELGWTTDEHGCKDAAWSVYLPHGDRHPALTRGAPVEIVDGPVVIWAGLLDLLNWNEGTFGAKGFSYDAENFVAIDTLGAATATPSDAVDGAIARGWRVTRGVGIPTTAFSANTDASLRVGALLTSSADELGQRWSVRADGVVRMEADSTDIDWLIRPGLVELGLASEEWASSIVVTYLDMGSAPANTIVSDSEAASRFEVKEYPLDLTPLGPMDLARAQGYAQGVLDKGKARLGWTSPIEVSTSDIMTAGGERADLTLVRSGQVARAFLGFDDIVSLGGRTHLDVAIGSTSYADESNVLTIGPVGSVAQTLSEVVSKLTESAAA